MNPDKIRMVDYLKVSLYAALLALLVMLPTMVLNHGMFLMRGDDFIQQQVAFIIECKRLIATGAPWWSHLTGLGGNAIAAFSYYTLGSPYFWMLVPFPITWIPYLMSVAMMVKFIVSAVACFWASSFFLPKRGAYLAAILYTFSGFTIINLQFQFMDVISVFPLLVAGIEMVVRNRRNGPVVLAAAIAINAMMNYYFFIGQTIFLAIYLLFRVITNHDFVGRRIRLLSTIAISYIIGVGVAAVLLVPSIMGVMGNPRAEVANKRLIGWLLFKPLRYLEIVRAFFMPPEGLVKHAFYANTASWTSTGIYLPVFGFTMVMAYVTRQRTWLQRLIIACLVMSIVPVANASFSAFTVPFYTRWWYMLAFIMAIGTADIMTRQEAIKSRAFTKYYAISVVVCILLTLPFGIVVLKPEYLDVLSRVTGISWFANYRMQMASDICMGGPIYVASAWALCALNYICLGLILVKRPGPRLVYTVVGATAAINAMVFVQLNNNDVINAVSPMAHPTDMRYIVDRVINHIDIKNDINEYHWRIDYPHELRNYGMFANLPTPNIFISVRSASMAGFQEIMDCGKPSFPAFLMPYDRPALRALLSVKYYINYDPDHITYKPWGFSLVNVNKSSKLYINNHYIPMGMAYDTYCTLDDVNRHRTHADRLLLHAVLLDKEQMSKYGQFLKPFRDNNRPMLSTAAFVADVQARRRNACSGFTANSRGFTAKIELKKPGMLFFSVPWDKGWTARLDGQPAAIEKVNLGFVGLMVPAGSHDIEFTYFPPGLLIGALMSIISIAVLVSYSVIVKLKSRNSFNTSVDPTI
ncbi:MAG: YfhO family protein [Armatimonadota bacterium]